MTKQSVEVKIPDGWKLVAYRAPKQGEYYYDPGLSNSVIKANFSFEATYAFVVERDKPERRVFEKVSNDPIIAGPGDYIDDVDGRSLLWWPVYYNSTTRSKHIVWREVDEREES